MRAFQDGSREAPYSLGHSSQVRSIEGAKPKNSNDVDVFLASSNLEQMPQGLLGRGWSPIRRPAGRIVSSCRNSRNTNRTYPPVVDITTAAGSLAAVRPFPENLLPEGACPSWPQPWVIGGTGS